MFSKLFKLVALGAVLLQLADGLLATCGHSHGPPSDHHACHQVAEHSCHHHQGESADHHDSETTENEPSLPCDHDSDHCAACRHLAQAVTHQFAIISLPTAEQVALVSPRLQSLERSHSAHDYLSRGPPAIAL
jgi:hypothetical protein